MFKKDLEENYKNIETRNIFMLVNDVCNATCNYCIMGLNNTLGIKKGDKLKEMTKETFDLLLRKIKNNNILGFVFAGKEPLIWSNLEYSLNKIKKLGMGITIFSNGINTNVKLTSNTTLVLHLDKKFIKTDYKKWFIKSKEEGFKLNFMCVVSSDNSIDELEYYINIIKKYGNGYLLSPKVPTGFGISAKISIAKMLFVFRELYKNGYKNYQFAHPIANCLIRKEDIKFLYMNKINFYGKCDLGYDICIDYNGKDYYPCPGFPRKKEIGKNALNDLGRDIFKYASDLRLNHPPKEECYTCGMYKNGQCQGGCLIERVL